LQVLAFGLERFDAACSANCLMCNHYHFVVQMRSCNRSRFMRHPNGVNTQRYTERRATTATG
jgi:hypothetical protein